MSPIREQKKELSKALNALSTVLEQRSKPQTLLPESLMTDEDIHLYCNRHIGLNNITEAMRAGEIENCDQSGERFTVQKQYVDEWLDRIFNITTPCTVAGGLKARPVTYSRRPGR